jgi:hypothetical protein
MTKRNIQRKKLSEQCDFIGKRFGKLTVVKESKFRPTMHRYFDCVCDCGTAHHARGALLVDGKVTKCKCCSSRQTQETKKAKGPKNVADFALAVYQMAAKSLRLGITAMKPIMEAAHAELVRQDCLE